MKKIFTFLILLFSLLGSNSQTTQTFISSGSFTVPAGVTSIFVEAWGSGGGGGGAKGTTSFRAMGGAGGGGAYNSGIVIVTPGDIISYTVAAQTAASVSTPVDGSTSSFLSISANGGFGGVAVTASTAHIGGAGGAGGIGQFNGGAGGSSVGYAGSTAGTTAGAGGGGGTTAAGSDGGLWSTIGGQLNGGAGGISDGGAGSKGQGSSGNVGLIGTAPGGGGSGAYAAASITQRNGGAGARGQIRITYPVTFDTKLGATNWSLASSWEQGVVPPVGATVRIDNDIILDVVVTVGIVNLNGGKVTLGANSLTATSVINGSASSYVITDGVGALKINGLGIGGASTTLFPIGPNATTYMPATLTNTGTLDNYSVIAAQSLPSCLSGAPAPAINSVNAVWKITEDVAAGSNVALILDYATSTTGGGYLSSSAKIVHCNSNTVDYANGTITGTVASGAGFTSFSDIGITSDVIVLPIKLTSFTAINKINQIDLNWNVATETNIANYEIEKSTDGINFIKIGTVLAQNLGNYNFMDKNITIGNSYYKLKINETNNSFNYSLVAKVKLNGKALNIYNIYPSPAIENIKIQINYTNNTNAIIEINDLNGKVVKKENITLINGLTEKTININQLKVGTYFVKVIAANEISVERFLKQ